MPPCSRQVRRNPAARCIVHPETVDLGEVVIQRRVPVLAGDDAAMLAARVLEEEHVAIVEAIRRFVPALTPTR